MLDAANVGHILILVRADAFLGLDEYHERTERFCNEIKDSEKAPGVTEIFLPGERERNMEQILTKQGIEVPSTLLEEFEQIAAKYGVSMVH